uniref:Uncharacterized protein n=1 Tax=Plectus sambesii TaxID=2011161 RepID=A0A914X1D3_9BILA
MSQPKRKSVYKVDFAKEFQGIRKGKDDYHTHCIPCKDEINLTAMGKTAIVQHQEKPKHNENAKAAATTRSLSNFLSSHSAPTTTDDKTAAAEGAWAFHVATHNQSFSSTDCCSSDALFQTMFSDSDVAKKFSCGQDKTKVILTGVLAPYFTASKGVQVRLLDMESLPGEDSTMVANFIAQVLGKHQLQFENLVSFCADNAPVNFGDPQLAGLNNVFKKLQEKKKNLIPVGCPAHILHNAAQKAADRLPIDIEAIVFKLASYFKGSTCRHENFKDICKFFEINYETIPSHGPTRWLTLGKVIDRVLKLWDPLTTLFTSKDKSPRIFEEFFSLDESLPVLQFLHSVLGVFEKPLLLLQKSKGLLPELIDIVNSFKQQLNKRKTRKFFGASTRVSLQRLGRQEEVSLGLSFLEFYTTVIEYIDKWFHVEFLPTNISWIMLSKRSVDYYEIVEMAGQVATEIAKLDALFNEVAELNHMLQQIPDEIFDGDTAEMKWQKIFKDNDMLPCLYKLVSIILSIQVANSSVPL